MIDRDVALEALSTLCNANVTSALVVGAGAASLSIKTLISTVLESEETCQVSISSYVHLQIVLQGSKQAAPNNHVDISGVLSGGSHFIDEDEFFDPRFDYDFTDLRDTETYYRGGEVYERPCGWQRFALKKQSNIIYSTPDISVAESYSKKFTSKKTGKMYEVIMQNRINPEYREKHRRKGDYWLVSIPEGTPATEEHKMVEKAIRPYGLLLREV